jgi:hypothetical protein
LRNKGRAPTETKTNKNSSTREGRKKTTRARARKHKRGQKRAHKTHYVSLERENSPKLCFSFQNIFGKNGENSPPKNINH